MGGESREIQSGQEGERESISGDWRVEKVGWGKGIVAYEAFVFRQKHGDTGIDFTDRQRDEHPAIV